MSDHEARLQAIREGFSAANAEIVEKVAGLDDASVTSAPPGAWSPAQIGWHVARATEFFSGAIAGAIPDVMVPRPADFREQLATTDLSAKIRTFPILEPPADATREAAVAKLLATPDTFEDALGKVTPERCAAVCVQLPLGVFSLYEIGEFTVAHIHRHLDQIQRTLES